MSIGMVFDDDYSQALAEDKNTLTEADWLFAYDHLNMLIAEYTTLGMAGVATLYMKLLPLKRRYDAGIRTRELYNEIVICE